MKRPGAYGGVPAVHLHGKFTICLTTCPLIRSTSSSPVSTLEPSLRPGRSSPPSPLDTAATTGTPRSGGFVSTACPSRPQFDVLRHWAFIRPTSGGMPSLAPSSRTTCRPERSSQWTPTRTDRSACPDRQSCSDTREIRSRTSPDEAEIGAPKQPGAYCLIVRCEGCYITRVRCVPGASGAVPGAIRCFGSKRPAKPQVKCPVRARCLRPASTPQPPFPTQGGACTLCKGHRDAPDAPDRGRPVVAPAAPSSLHRVSTT